MLSYNELLPGTFIVLDGAPYEVLSSRIFRKQQNKPVNAAKLRNLVTGKVVERTFHSSESVEEAEVEKRKATFLYRHRGAAWFCEAGNPKARFSLSEEAVGSALPYLKEGTEVDAVAFNDAVIGVRAPIKVALTVSEAPPAVRGNTAQNATKQVTLETGATLTVPLFIQQGDIVRVNTETGTYVERVAKGA